MAPLNDVTDELLASIATLLEAGHDRATLILLYAAIDILGALCTRGGQATRDSFAGWCDTYMDPENALGCSADELYGARCGVLHRMSPETSRTSTGAARRFVYVRDILGGPVMPAPSSDPGIVTIQPTGLWVCFRDGVSKFSTEVAKGGTLGAQVTANLDEVYVTVERR